MARALFGNPSLLLLDEPNASLDGEGEAALVRVLQQIKSAGVTVVAVTHRPSLLTLADQIVALRDGQIEYFGPPPAAESAANSDTPIRDDLPARRPLPRGIHPVQPPTIEQLMGSGS
ncbi:hypothetical protein [Paraburkholderia sp. J63]|uniref:hypothetical protein n=1 Tax=Paraburkholderia sp. J63 TaxID=2805434 RepID=UPI002ABE06AD|nr:hypothetical protein [Paraburkholderia sp. J63]